MKHIRVLISLLLVCVLLIPTAVIAEKPQQPLATTAEFLSYCDEHNLIYDHEGFYASGREGVSLTYRDDAFGSKEIEIVCLFDANEEAASISIWDIAAVAAEKVQQATELCNTLNAKYRFCKLFLDPEGNQITMESDLWMYPGTGTVGPQCGRQMSMMLNMLSSVYDSLTAFQP